MKMYKNNNNESFEFETQDWGLEPHVLVPSPEFDRPHFRWIVLIAMSTLKNADFYGVT